MLRPFLLLMLVICSLQSIATHTKGGWMYYEYLGPGAHAATAKYKIGVYLYTICNAGPELLDSTIKINIFIDSANSDIYRTIDAPLVNKPDVSNCPTCGDCIVNKPSICYQYRLYETIIDLPIISEGYILNYQVCCRIKGIINIINSERVGDVWTINIPGTRYGTNAPFNSSPKFISNDTAIVCANSFFTFDFKAIDKNGDMLIYAFAPAFNYRQYNPNPPYPSVPYASPYTYNEPLGPNVTIDFLTGKVTGRAPSTVGEYVITVIVQEYNNGYKGESRKSLHIQVASCNVVDAALLADNKCDGLTKTFKNNAPDPPGVSYLWDFGVPGITTDTSTLPNPTFTYPDTGTYNVTLAVSLNKCLDTSMATVKVYPAINPDFLLTSQCKNTPIQFTDITPISFANAYSWFWDFGDMSADNTSSLRNPRHIYSNTGNYNVSLTVNNGRGCINTITKSITIKENIDLSITKDTLICSIDTLRLNAAGNGNIFWTPNYNIDDQHSASPLVSPDVPTMYYATLSTPSTCTATDSVFVDVKSFVSIDAGKDTGVCAGDPIKLNPLSDALHYQWSPAVSLNDPLIKYPTATPRVTTKYFVIGNIGKCQSTDSVIIKVIPYPGTGGIPDTVLCFGNAIQFQSSGGSSYLWSPSLFLNNPNVPNPIATPNRNIRYIVTIHDTLGCPKPSFDTVLVTVQRISVDAGPPDTSVVLNQPLQLNATGAQNYTWTPSTGLNNSLISNPVANLSDNIKYTVTGISPEGCTSSDTIHVHVYKVVPGIYVPNAFTPNGDGLNDVFRPIAIGIKKINQFRVFNRWGILMYSSDNIYYAANAGWDGTYKGKPLDTAVFVWIVEGVDFLDNKITQKGTVTLIR